MGVCLPRRRLYAKVTMTGYTPLAGSSATAEVTSPPRLPSRTGSVASIAEAAPEGIRVSRGESLASLASPAGKPPIAHSPSLRPPNVLNVTILKGRNIIPMNADGTR